MELESLIMKGAGEDWGFFFSGRHESFAPFQRNFFQNNFVHYKKDYDGLNRSVDGIRSFCFIVGV